MALGDGLAFGVGMALSQKAAHREPAAQRDITSAGKRLQDLERRMALLENAPVRLDPKVLETIVGVFEADLRDRDEQWSRRLTTTVESAAAALRQEQTETVNDHRQGVIADLRGREEQWSRRLTAAVESAAASLRQEQAEAVSALRQDVAADLRTLESQDIAGQQELTESIPRLIDERVAAHLDTGAIEAAMERKLEEYRTELADRNLEIVELRDRLAASQQHTLDLLMAIGQACREAAERMSPPPTPAEASSASLASPTAPEAEENTPPAVEEISRVEIQSGPTWSLPMVSSLLVALSGCFVCLHWI